MKKWWDNEGRIELIRWLLTIGVVSCFWTGVTWSDYCHLKSRVDAQERKVANMEEELIRRYEELDRKVSGLDAKMDIVLRRINGWSR